MLGDGAVGVTACPARAHHGLERDLPIAAVGMHVQVGAQVLELDQPGQRAGASELDLAGRLAQLGRDPGQIERPVDLLLGAPRHPLAIRFAAGQAVFVERQALVDRDAPQLDVVRLAAGEIEQRRAERRARHHAHVHLEAAPELDRGFGLPLAEDVGDVGVAHERLHHRLEVRAAHQHVEVADGLAAAPEGTGDLDLLDTRDQAQALGDRLGHRPGPGEQGAAGVHRCPLERLEDLLLRLLAEAGQVAERARPRRPLEVGAARDPEPVVERAHALRSQALDVGEIDQPGRVLLLHFLVERGGAGPDQVADLLRQILADAGQPFEPALLVHLGRQRLGHLSDDARRLAVGAHPEGVGAVELEHDGDALEDPGDVGVGHGAILIVAPRRASETRPRR